MGYSLYISCVWVIPLDVFLYFRYTSAAYKGDMLYFA